MVGCTESVFQFIKKWKWFIMIFWSVCAIGCCFFALDLPNQTVFSFLPPSGSESDVAYKQMEQYFPDLIFIDFEVILVQTKWDVKKENLTIIQNNNTQSLVKAINDTIWNDINPKYNLLSDVQTYYDFANVTTLQNVTINNETYPFNQAMINNAMSAKYVSSSGNCMLIFIESDINGANTVTLDNYINDIKSSLVSINSHYNQYSLVLTGGITIFQDSMQTITNDITSKDMFMLPLIFCIMIYMIGSWKLVALPGASLGMTIVISFGIFYPFSINLLEVNPTAPSIMMFLSMALSIDYSMFLLSRFAMERKRGSSVDDAVRAMLRFSAHVVLLSGTVLIICYQAIVIFPIAGMETVGYGAGITIFCCMIINISMSASAILAFPNYFGHLEAWPSCLVRCCAKCICCPFCWKYQNYGIENKEETLLVVSASEQNDDDPLKVVETNDFDHSRIVSKSISVGGAAAYNVVNDNVTINDGDGKIMRIQQQPRHDSEEPDEIEQNCYFKLTQYTTRWPYKLICPLTIYALMIPAIFTLFQMEFSIDFTLNFPKHISSVDAYDTLINDFDPGNMAPIYTLVKSKDAEKEGAIWDVNYFHALCVIGSELVNAGYENITQMTSIGFVANAANGNLSCIQTQRQILEYKTLINHPDKTPIRKYINTSYWNAYMNWFNSSVNQPEQSVSVILGLPNFNPYTSAALDGCINYRDTVNKAAKRADVEPYVDVYVHQSLFWEVDSLYKVDDTLPYGLTIIIVVVFILIGFVFRAVFLPLRLFLCVIVPILFVYGMVTGIFQKGWLEWTSWESVQKDDGIYWMLPVVTCTVLAGLALDYEIFLYSRVFEYRSRGYTTTAAIILGVSSTGPIISAAGVVMAMAFGGLLLETIVCSNQMGMVFVLGVLVDTFIVRPMLVPSILSFADQLNWWPSKMPVGYKNEYGQIILDKETVRI